MNALEAKARQERFASLVEGDPLGRTSFGPAGCPLDLVLKGAPSARLAELVAALGNVDANRVAHHLLARGYVPTDADPDLYERRAWHSYPWPAPAAESRASVGRLAPRDHNDGRGLDVAARLVAP